MLTLSGYSSPRQAASSPYDGGLSPMTSDMDRAASQLRRASSARAGAGPRRAAASRERASFRPASSWTVRRLLPWTVSALLLVLLLVSLWGVGGAEGAEIAPAGPDEGTVVVTAGDTLWSIASAHAIAADTREGVYRLQKRNGLASPSIEPGDTLIIPATR
ncbi:LysM peptidoglycan-binding domain-containing protein [Paenibacillus pasadenensis]|nr:MULTISPECIES: LysM peptidoglycan-binding domain-containing protein [Paenibacillus]QGG56258.1 LysM peptidoglycan-binding domain-containing protein [Paenibacillus sp. B01]